MKNDRNEWRGGEGISTSGRAFFFRPKVASLPSGIKLEGTNEQRQARYRAMTAFKRPFFFFTPRFEYVFRFFSSLLQLARLSTNRPKNEPPSR